MGHECVTPKENKASPTRLTSKQYASIMTSHLSFWRRHYDVTVGHRKSPNVKLSMVHLDLYRVFFSKCLATHTLFFVVIYCCTNNYLTYLPTMTVSPSKCFCTIRTGRVNQVVIVIWKLWLTNRNRVISKFMVELGKNKTDRKLG